MNYLPAIYTEAEPADIVLSTEEGTYIGKFDRTKYDPTQDAEGQAIWSIRFIETLNENTVKTLYPDGIKQSVYVWNNREEYNYKYAL